MTWKTEGFSQCPPDQTHKPGLENGRSSHVAGGQTAWRQRGQDRSRGRMGLGEAEPAALNARLRSMNFILRVGEPGSVERVPAQGEGTKASAGRGVRMEGGAREEKVDRAGGQQSWGVSEGTSGSGWAHVRVELGTEGLGDEAGPREPSLGRHRASEGRVRGHKARAKEGIAEPRVPKVTRTQGLAGGRRAVEPPRSVQGIQEWRMGHRQLQQAGSGMAVRIPASWPSFPW